jgi:sugar phosphate isomerase/epimerase
VRAAEGPKSNYEDRAPDRRNQLRPLSGRAGMKSGQLGVFARIFTRLRAEDVAAAVADAGFTLTQFNLSCTGLPTLPPEEMDLGFPATAVAFSARGVKIWGLSATYNAVDPDPERRGEATQRAKCLIDKAPGLGAEVVTLCTGSRNAEDMWRYHPDNLSEDAWRDLRATLDQLLPAAERAGVRLVIEPEPGNVVADAALGRRLLDELGEDARLVGIVLDPANLVPESAVTRQDEILRQAFAALGPQTVALHAKDVVPGGGYAAAGLGRLDYDLVFELYETLPVPVPVIIQDAVEDDVARTRDFLLAVGEGPASPRMGH